MQLEDSDRRISRREFLQTTGVAGIGAVAVGLMAYRTPHQFEVNHHEAEVRGLRAPLRVSLLTDFHLGPHLSGADLAAWIEASNAAAPDLVLLGGDLVDQRYRGDLGELRTLLPELDSTLGTYAVPGNHDRTRYRNLEPFEAALGEAGVPLLVNAGVTLRDDLYLAGIDDFRVGEADVEAALSGAPAAGSGSTAGHGDAGREEAAGDAAPATDTPARVLLSHNPDVIPELPGVGQRAVVDLLMAGHTHGGQIKIPGLGPLVTSSAYGARYAEGWVPAPMPAFVSRGLGVTAIPFRFACPAEAVIIDLVPAVSPS